MIKGLASKFADAKLSDLNYNLGKIKEGVVTESGEYLDNFKSDLSLVSSLVKTETEKIKKEHQEVEVTEDRVHPVPPSV